LSKDDLVIEIGPGLGILTRDLAMQAGRVSAVEIDRGLAANLKKELAGQPGVQIIEGDILKIPVEQILEPWGLPHPVYKVVANLPYYITTAVIHHFLGSRIKPKIMVVMVQREVGESIMASPGDMSLLAVTIQYYARVSRVKKVSPGVFFPPPKVSSVILKLELLDQPAVKVNDAERFFKLVKAGFSARRKQLRNSISRGLDLDSLAVVSALRRAGVDPQRRAQTLTLEEWASIYCQIENHVKD
jgi:16S rRNA (adenine1518-N6/adenine1519-N6)-dimethyltransferase